MAEQYRLQKSIDGKMRLDVKVPFRLQLHEVAAIVWTDMMMRDLDDVDHFKKTHLTRFGVMQCVLRELKWNGLESILNAVGEIEDEEPFKALLAYLTQLWSKW